MSDLLLLFSALAGVSAWLWVAYHEYSETAEVEVDTDQSHPLSDPKRALLRRFERSSDT